MDDRTQRCMIQILWGAHKCKYWRCDRLSALLHPWFRCSDSIHWYIVAWCIHRRYVCFFIRYGIQLLNSIINKAHDIV